jgi:hypothetical protein
MNYYNNMTTTGRDDTTPVEHRYEGKHFFCREQVYYNLDYFAELLQIGKQHLIGYGISEIYKDLCGCEQCKIFYNKYIHLKDEYIRTKQCKEGEG